jgi:N-acetylglucosaminyldiphosphoundecaprenol N-acetyl-beta-D-mannosaminyltransferase
MGVANREMTTLSRGAPVNILGVPVEPWTLAALLSQLDEWTLGGPPRTVLYANVHVLNMAYTNEHLRRELRRASMVYCDGSGVRLAAQFLGQHLPPRLTGADWIEPVCNWAARTRVPVFIVAGRPGVADHASRILVARHPGFNVCGTHHGFLDESSSDAVIGSINRSGARLVFVGMGTPQQELWIAKCRDRLAASVVWAVGALFDFVSGAERRGPRWLLNHHLEWLVRLTMNPRRHWKRYLIGNPMFVGRILRQGILGLPRHLLEDGFDVSGN